MKQVILGRRKVGERYGVTESTIRWLEDIKKIKPKKVLLGNMWFMSYAPHDQKIIGQYTTVKHD